MIAALTVVVLLAASEPEDVEAPMARAAEQTLGDEAHVVFRRVDGMPADADAVALAQSLHADALAELAWSDGRRTAALHLYLTGASRWVDRDLRFEPGDAPAERGRTLGFAVASMVPEETRHAPPPEPPAPPPPAPPPVPPVAAAPPSAEQPAPPAAEREWRGAVDATGVVTSTIGTGAAVGGAIGGEAYVSPHWGVRGAASLRAGELDPIDASTLTFDGALGVAWRTSDATRRRPFGLGAHADFLVTRQALTHRSRTTQLSEDESRWIPGAQLVVEGTWSFSEGAAAVLGGGAQVAFGKTDVYLRGVPAAAIDPVSLVAQAGIRARF